MLKLLERSIASVESRLVLVAPPSAVLPGPFRNVQTDTPRHRALVREMQKLRGSVYLQDGAVERRHLSWDGLHRTPEDAKSWHLLMLNSERRISACVWYLQHDMTIGFHSLRARRCPLAEDEAWRSTLKKAVESELQQARSDNVRYAEVGGWAVANECRCTSEGLVLALAAYSLGRLCGGALGMTTATARHCSSTILRRLGGQPLEADGTTVPSLYDPRYKCEMELLRFDSRKPAAKYAGLIERLREKLTQVMVIAPAVAVADSYADEGSCVLPFAPAPSSLAYVS